MISLTMTNFLLLIFIITALIGNWFIIKKNPIGYYYWILSNLGLIIHNLTIKQYLQAFLFFIFLVLAIYGLFTWREK